jgi:hypothetical protein
MAQNNRTENYRSPWGEAPAEKKSPEQEKFSAVAIIAAVAAILVVGAVGYYLLYLRVPEGANVGLEFSTSGQILVGSPFVFTVSLSNYSNNILKNAKLSLMLPDSLSFIGQPLDQRVFERTMGDLGPGSINKPDFPLLVVTSGSNSVKHIDAKLTYGTDQSPSTQFEYSSGADIVIGAPAISLNMAAPQSIFNGQDFDIKVDYANNTGVDFKNVHLKIDYPPIFQFKRSSVNAESESGNNSWNLGTVPAGSSATTLITGNVIGPEKSFVNFVASLNADFSGVTYPINSQTVNVGIASAPLSLEVVPAAGDNPDSVPGPGDSITYSLNYKNNSDVVMQNVVVSVKLTGEMFDFSTIRTDGAFNSLSNTITWLAANTPELANVTPGQGGSVGFDVKVKGSFPIRLLSDKNFTLKAQAQITSPTVPPNTAASKTISVANSETKIAGKLDIAAEGYWRDAKSGILNNGPYPPRVNQPTECSIHWRLTNYATDVTNITVSAYLQSSSRFTGTVKSNMDTSPSYNPNTGLVTWQIPYIPATKGILGAPAEAIFQIENTPAVNQVNQNVPLLGETKLEWTDSFTGQMMQASALPLDTSLPHDKTITTMDRVVKQ